MEYVLICVAVVMFLGIVVAPMICIEVIDNMTKGYSNKDFIDHLAEDKLDKDVFEAFRYRQGGLSIPLDERIKQEIEKPLSMKKLEAKMRYIYRHQENLSKEERVSEIRQEPNEFLRRKKPFRCI